MASTNAATISWSAANGNGSAISAYEVHEITGGNVGESTSNDGTSTKLTLTGLAGGVATTFSVVAFNSCGASAATMSTAVTPTGAPVTYASAVIGDKPTVYYRLGEPSGTTMTDSSGHSQDGQYDPQTILAQPGGALLSDPAAPSVGDPEIYGGIGSSPATLPQFNDPRSVSAWVNSAATNEPLVVAWGSPGTDQSFIVGFDQSAITVDGDNDFHAIPTGHPIADSNWHLIAVTYDGTTISAYLDGKLQGTAAFTSTLATFGSALALGSSPNYYSAYNGSLQDIAVYPTALTSTQIAAQYTASGYVVPAAPPAAHAAPGGPNTAQVTWGDIANQTEPILSYLITVASGPNAGMALSASGDATAVRLSGLAAGATTFTVKAINQSGAGPAATTNSYIVPGSATTYASVVASSAPKVFYRLGDGSPLTVADSSGHSAEGVYNSDVTLGSAGPLIGDTTSAAAAGSGGGIGSAGGTLPLYNTARTAESWFQTTTNDSYYGPGYYQTLLSWGGTGTDQTFTVGQSANAVWVDGTNDAHSFATPYALSDGAWHFVAVTYSGTTFTVYLDGVAIGSGRFRQPLNTVPPQSTGVYLGQVVPGSSNLAQSFVQGSLANIAVFSTALTASQLASQFTASGRARPTVPASVTATAAANKATVHWSAATAPGSTITSYLVSAISGTTAVNSIAVPGSSTSAVVSGLAGGTSYTFEVKAVDSYGTGGAGLTASTVTPTGSATTYASTVLSDSPSLYYRLGDSTATLMADSSGHGQNGTYVASAVTLGQTGAVVGDSDTATLDETGEALGTSASQSLPLNNSPRSIVAWINDTSLPSNGEAVVSWGQPTTDEAFMLDASSNDIRVDGWGDVHIAVTPYALNDGSWHEIAVTYSGSSYSLYLDGRLLGSGAFSSSLDTAAGPLMIGSDVNDEYGPQGGLLDEVSVYPAALTSTQIAAQFTAAGYSRPAAPTSVVALAGSNRATVSWSAPPKGASPLTGYIVTALAGGTLAQNAIAVPGTATSAVLSGLAAGTSYTFRVTATNGYGAGTAAVSAALTPTGLTSPYSATVLADKPLAYYRLGDSTTAVMADSSGHAVNGSYNSSAVTLGQSGAVVGDPDAAVQDADGTQGIGSASVSLPLYNSARSVVAWFAENGASDANQDALVSWGQPATDQAFQLMVSGSDQIDIDGWSDTHVLTTPYSITDGSWHQVAVSYTGTSFTVYLDGVSIGTGYFNAPLDTHSSLLYVGGGSLLNYGPTGADLDEVSVYSSALTSTQIAAQFASSGHARPSAPTAVTAQAGKNKATIGWTAPTAPGATITAYQVTAFTSGAPGLSVAVPASSTSVVLSGLTGATGYTFEVRALDAYGWGAESAASSAVIPTGATSTYPSTVLADQPAAYYRLSDGSTAVMSDSSGHAATGSYNPDNVTLGSTGAIVGDPATAAQEAGDGTIATATPTLPTGNDSRSLVVWLNDTALPQSGQDAVASWGSATQDEGFQLFASASTIGADAWSDYHPVTTPYPINDGAWHQVAVTYDGTHYVLYLDGRQLGTGVFAATLDTVSTTLNIGADDDGNVAVQGATIGDTSVYATALTATQIAAQFTAAGYARPAAPSTITALAGTNQVTVGWAPPTSPGSPVNAYVLTAYAGTKVAGSKSVSGAATSAVITGLPGGVAYTIKVTAHNSYGYGSAGTSTSVTPTGATSTYASTVLSDSPTVYYRLGDSSTTVLADSSANLAHGFYNTGNVTLGTVGAIVGDPDTAATVNGEEIATATPTLPTEQHARSVVAWVQSTYGGTQYIAGWGSPMNTQEYTVGFDPNDIYVDEYGTALDFVTSASITDGGWHQIAVTATGTAATAYLDGTKIGTQTFATPLETAPGGQLLIGDSVWGQTLYGSLDDLAIFATALTAAQITALQTASGALAPTPKPKGHPVAAIAPSNPARPAPAAPTNTSTAPTALIAHRRSGDTA